MNVSYTWVPSVSVDDPITSTQAKLIANACNDRYIINLGDCMQRHLGFYWSLMRNLVEPQPNALGGLDFVPDHWFFTHAQMGDASDIAPYPQGEPGGDPDQGTNLANHMGAFVHGSDDIDLYSEARRIADDSVGGVPLRNVASLEDAWVLGIEQRGGFDPNTGGVASPSFKAATEHFKIISDERFSPFGNTYGGLMPGPAVIEPRCSDPETGETWDSFQHIFTRVGAVNPTCGGTVPMEGVDMLCFPGTCPGVAGNVAGVYEDPNYIYVFIYGEPVLMLPANEWVQGPYTNGGRIKRNFGYHFQRLINAFAGEFNGTEAERSEPGAWLRHAFDTERFLTSQYMLAPARGVENPETGEITVNAYPRFSKTLTLSAFIPDGTLLTHEASGTTQYAYHEACVIGSAYIKAHKLVSGTIEFLNGSTVIKTVILSPGEGGATQKIVTFEEQICPAPLKVRVNGDMQFMGTTGYILVDTSELMRYKPQGHDLYLTLRLASSRDSLTRGLDGVGQDQDNSNWISDSYFENGCVLNINGSFGPAGSFTGEINSNAIFDVARRMSQTVRIVPRLNLVGYEVQNGKSICYFKRLTQTADGTDDPAGVDLFKGIAAPRDPVSSGDIKPNRTYLVRGSVGVIYNGVTYNVGQTFAGVTGVTDYSAASEGTPSVREVTGSRPQDPGEWTNEWLMDAFFKPYSHDNDYQGRWGLDQYTNLTFWSDRCHWGHYFANYGDLNYLFDYGATLGPGDGLSVAPESTTGWRYANGTNKWDCVDAEDDPLDFCRARRRSRYKSCRIYETPAQAESFEMLFEDDVEIVKVTFKQRFHHSEYAPATISRDVATWSAAAVQGEPYRTMENGIREYLLWWNNGAKDGPHCIGGGQDLLRMNVGQLGNSAFIRSSQPNPWGMPDAPNGACFPDFYFVKLASLPYDDGNDTQDPVDSKLMAEFWRDIELRIRVMCEGFVDGATSVAYCASATNSLYCYTLQTLCLDAFGKKWFTTLPTVATSRIPASKTRPDAPMGFGPLPNVTASSEVYNQFAAALNKLTKVPIMFPVNFEVRNITGSAFKVVSQLDWPEDTFPNDCDPEGATPGGYWNGSPAEATANNEDPEGWVPAEAASSSVSAGFLCDSCTEAGEYKLTTTRTDNEWRWRLWDPDAIHAIPELWRGLIFDANGVMQSTGRVLGYVQYSEVRKEITRDDVQGASECESAWTDPATGEWLHDTGVPLPRDPECIVLPQSGRISATVPVASDFLFRRVPEGEDGGNLINCCSAAVNTASLIPIGGNDSAFIEVPFTSVEDTLEFELWLVNGLSSERVARYHPDTGMFHPTETASGKITLTNAIKGSVSWQGIAVQGEYSLLANSDGDVYIKTQGSPGGGEVYLELRDADGPVIKLSKDGDLEASGYVEATEPGASGPDRVKIFDKVSIERDGSVITSTEFKTVGLLATSSGEYITNHEGFLIEVSP